MFKGKLATSRCVTRVKCIGLLRYFAGLTQEQVAETLGISLRAAERHWTWAKAWLFRRIHEQE